MARLLAESVVNTLERNPRTLDILVISLPPEDPSLLHPFPTVPLLVLLTPLLPLLLPSSLEIPTPRTLAHLAIAMPTTSAPLDRLDPREPREPPDPMVSLVSMEREELMRRM